MVANMWKSNCKRKKDWTPPLEGSFSSKGPLTPFPFYENISSSKGQLEERIAQIQDPLWRRVCIDMLSVLGPLAFSDLWRVSFETTSSGGRIAHLTCPSLSLAKTIEQYHFVIIDALKKFYPFLTSLDTEVRDIFNEDLSAAPYHYRFSI